MEFNLMLEIDQADQRGNNTGKHATQQTVVLTFSNNPKIFFL
jgi:hypothetical protein